MPDAGVKSIAKAVEFLSLPVVVVFLPLFRLAEFLALDFDMAFERVLIFKFI